MGTADCKPSRASKSYCWIAYCSVSLLALLVLCIDPYVNSPSGLIALELFTHEPVRHGSDACSWDYDGSWKIGGLSGASLQHLNISEKPLFTCENVDTTTASFVAAPFLCIPEDGEHSNPSVWSLFFELRNLRSYTSEIGVATSRDRGVSWQYRGTVLSDARHSFTAPFVVYDAPMRSYIMLPDTTPHGQPPHDGLPAYTTSAEEFPFGWRPVAPHPHDHHPHPHHGHHHHSHERSHHHRSRHLTDQTVPGDVDSSNSHHPWQTRSDPTTPFLPSHPWGPPPTRPTFTSAFRRTHYRSTTAVRYNDRWWIFTTRVQFTLLPWLPAALTPLVFTTASNSSLISPWRLHGACSGQQDWGQEHAAGSDRGRMFQNPKGDDDDDDTARHRQLHAQLQMAPPPPSGGCGRVSALRPSAVGRGGAGAGSGDLNTPLDNPQSLKTAAEGSDEQEGGGDVLMAAGRPFVWQGAIHRWVRRCSHLDRCSHNLDLVKSVVANEGGFVEEVAASYAPAAARDQSWHARRLGHADVRWVSGDDGDANGGGGTATDGVRSLTERGGRWWGLVSGDRYENGMHHFLVHESWFVELKAALRNFVAAQLALALVVVALMPQAAEIAAMGSHAAAAAAAGGAAAAAPRHHHADDGDEEDCAEDGSPVHGVRCTIVKKLTDYCNGGGSHHSAHHGQCDGKSKHGGMLYGTGGVSGVVMRVRSCPAATSVLAATNAVSCVTQIGVAGLATGCAYVEYGVRRAAAQPVVQFIVHAVGACFLGLALSLVAMVSLPSAVPCPRWTVVVKPFGSSPHYVPSHPYVDPAAPYDVRNLTLVSGCTMSFMDRLENLVGSLQYWEPDSPIVLYDLGFTSKQLATVRCWRGVRVVRFPYEDYPAHVREIGNYAFKPLVFAHALARHPAMLWIDCGLEVRGPLDSMRGTLSRSGHVSAQQSKAPSQFLFTEKYTLPFFNVSTAEYDRVKDLPFCAGGLQGFVAGSAAERLILKPAVACALDPNCISPPGHTQTLHMYDQTALTLHIRMYNFSTCMPRETHCTSAVKKTSWDPAASSDPIVIASRRHRWPKPYRHRVVSEPGCTANPSSNPWRSVSSEHPETVTKSSSLLFKLGYVYGQAAGDLAIQAGCCLGFHLLAQSLLAAMILAGEAHRQLLLYRAGFHSGSSLTGPPLSPGCSCSRVGMGPTGSANCISGGGCSAWIRLLLRPKPLLAAFVLQVVVMALSMGVTCRVP